MSEILYKYPRTFHLPFSPELSKDDKRLSDDSIFKDKEVVVSLKMDGENTTLYPDYLHARSINPMKHSSQDWIKSFHSKIKFSIPQDHRICGENLFATHSIEYTNLESFFYAFSVWNKKTCLDWSTTENFFKSLNIKSVPVIFQGTWNKDLILKEWEKHKHNHEGFVVRISDSFSLENFQSSVAKYVRKNHVQTDVHWKTSWQPNKLKNKS